MNKTINYILRRQSRLEHGHHPPRDFKDRCGSMLKNRPDV